VSALSMWTVYDHPSDFPDGYVARRFDGEQPTSDVIESADLDLVRYSLAMKGLFCLARSPGDDPVILETWL
jgi:hypothetical protein